MKAANYYGVYLLMVIFLLPVVLSQTAAAEEGSWIDRDNFPEAYSILTSEHVMFPGNIRDRLLKIDSARQLFVDDYIISSMENLTRQFHQVEKYPGNPIMPGTPVAVMYDQKNKKFRMWDGNYAESPDGVTWEIIKHGPFFGTAGAEIRGIFCNQDIKDTEKMYQAVVMKRYNETTNEPGGFYLYHSPDGLNWRQSVAYPIFKGTGIIYQTESTPYWSMDVGDTSDFRYDTVLKKYICDSKFNLYMPQEKFKALGVVQDNHPRLRLRTFLESDDLIHWGQSRFMMYPDKYDQPDCQLYGHVGFVYESMWIGALRVLHLIPAGFKQVDIQLTYSRDGRHWSRPSQRQPFIPLGDPNSWEADYSGVAQSGPVLVDDQLWFYYFGSRNGERDKLDHWGAYGIGLAKLRRDGFASLDAGGEVGKITTRPMTFEGKKLFINADIAKDGWVKAAILTSESQPVALYGLDDSVALTEDTTKGQMVWKSKEELVPPGDEHLRLVFQLKNAKLYSFWIE